MKGYGIYVKNNLLEDKHRVAMGESLWLYLWLLDKVTAVKNGKGIVLGRKPIKYQDFHSDFLSISRRTYYDWLNRLKKEKYIECVRTPYGTSIFVLKITKMFNNKIPNSIEADVHNDAHLVRQTVHLSAANCTSNKDNTVDNTVDNSNFSNEDIVLTNMLFEKIQNNFNQAGINRKRKSATPKDYSEMNKIHRIDGYEYKKIQSVIVWCQNDTFWKKNILSVPTLRKQFEKLVIQIPQQHISKHPTMNQPHKISDSERASPETVAKVRKQMTELANKKSIR